jgi:hypothetical protein
MAWRSSCSALIVFGTVLFSGCGDNGPRVLRINGTVTRADKPVARMVVNFSPEHGRPSWGLTDADGHYSLKYDKDRDGAVAGKHKVWVKVKPSSPKEEAEIAQGLIRLNPDTSKILEKYGRENSPLTVEVKDDNQVIDLPLD